MACADSAQMELERIRTQREAMELQLLTERLELLESKRSLAAVRCQKFANLMETALLGKGGDFTMGLVYPDSDASDEVRDEGSGRSLDRRRRVPVRRGASHEDASNQVAAREGFPRSVSGSVGPSARNRAKPMRRASLEAEGRETGSSPGAISTRKSLDVARGAGLGSVASQFEPSAKQKLRDVFEFEGNDLGGAISKERAARPTPIGTSTQPRARSVLVENTFEERPSTARRSFEKVKVADSSASSLSFGASGELRARDVFAGDSFSPRQAPTRRTSLRGTLKFLDEIPGAEISLGASGELQPRHHVLDESLSPGAPAAWTPRSGGRRRYKAGLGSGELSTRVVFPEDSAAALYTSRRTRRSKFDADPDAAEYYGTSPRTTRTELACPARPSPTESSKRGAVNFSTPHLDGQSGQLKRTGSSQNPQNSELSRGSVELSRAAPEARQAPSPPERAPPTPWDSDSNTDSTFGENENTGNDRSLFTFKGFGRAQPATAHPSQKLLGPELLANGKAVTPRSVWPSSGPGSEKPRSAQPEGRFSDFLEMSAPPAVSRAPPSPPCPSSSSVAPQAGKPAAATVRAPRPTTTPSRPWAMPAPAIAAAAAAPPGADSPVSGPRLATAPAIALAQARAPLGRPGVGAPAAHLATARTPRFTPAPTPTPTPAPTPAPAPAQARVTAVSSFPSPVVREGKGGHPFMSSGTFSLGSETDNGETSEESDVDSFLGVGRHRPSTQIQAPKARHQSASYGGGEVVVQSGSNGEATAVEGRAAPGEKSKKPLGSVGKSFGRFFRK